MELLKSLAMGGVGAVIAGYLIWKTIPDLVASFRAEQAETRRCFSDEMSKERHSHAGQLQALHAMMHERDEKIIGALSDLTRK